MSESAGTGLVDLEYFGGLQVVQVGRDSGLFVARADVTAEQLAAADLPTDGVVFGGRFQVTPEMAGATPAEEPPYGRGILAQTDMFRRAAAPAAAEAPVAQAPDVEAPVSDGAADVPVTSGSSPGV